MMTQPQNSSDPGLTDSKVPVPDITGHPQRCRDCASVGQSRGPHNIRLMILLISSIRYKQLIGLFKMIRLHKKLPCENLI